MLLVYLADRTPKGAMKAAEDVEKYLHKQNKLFCPICNSSDIYYSRSADGRSFWMEMRAICGGCGSQFAIPDTVLSGFWQKDRSYNKEATLTFKSA